MNLKDDGIINQKHSYAYLNFCVSYILEVEAKQRKNMKGENFGKVFFLHNDDFVSVCVLCCVIKFRN